MTEKCIAPDTYVSGLDHVELIGNGCARFVLYVHAPEDESEEGRRYFPIVMPISEVPDAIRKAMLVPTVDSIYATICRILPMWLH